MLLRLYALLFLVLTPVLPLYLRWRQKRGKEHPTRLDERFGMTHCARPEGRLIWVNAVSVGEAQTALILIREILRNHKDVQFLLTTVTTTSEKVVAPQITDLSVIHQFAPIDHPDWIARFLNHWKPDAALWMESELWPNTLLALKARHIPAALVNAHMSDRSFKLWMRAAATAKELMHCFVLGFAQSEQAAHKFRALGLTTIIRIDNLKYAAPPLPYNEEAYINLKGAIGTRPVWLYASTHANEELIAARIHKKLQKTIPDVLTIIVPRHPARSSDIRAQLSSENLHVCLRSETQTLPHAQDHIYLADTLGELGLFYKLSGIACIGRSFSQDGGGGHNPIEAAQHDCAIIVGPYVQNLQEIFDDFLAASAAIQTPAPDALYHTIHTLLNNPAHKARLIENANALVRKKQSVAAQIVSNLSSVLPFDRA